MADIAVHLLKFLKAKAPFAAKHFHAFIGGDSSLVSSEGNQENRACLPEDVIFNILTCVPISDLPNCRLVCCDWNRLTYEPTFLPTRTHQTGDITGCLIQGLDNDFRHNGRYWQTFVSFNESPPPSPPLSLNFLPQAVKIEAVSKHRGIVCCVSHAWKYRLHQYYVCKPATRQWRAIPNPKTRFQTIATAIVARPSGPLEYKIIRLSEPKNSYRFDHLRCEVFDSETWAWRQSRNVQLPSLELIGNRRPAVLVNGVLHWLTRDCDIFAFSLSENWELITLPVGAKGCNGWWDYNCLVSCQGLLTILHARGEKMDIWTMTNYAKKEWEHRGVVDLYPIRRNEVIPSVENLYTSDVAVIRDWHKVIWFGLKNKMVKGQSLSCTAEDLFMFESDSTPCSFDSRKSRAN